jgi:proteasome lid subunit RPN8/RPN11
MFSIPREIFQAMVEHARAALPNEACGILAGREGMALKVYPATNRDASPIHYQLEPTEQLRIFQEMEEKGWEFAGIYHSHVKAEAKPSREDIEIAYYPEALYLILSLRDQKNPVLRGFWIRDGAVEEEEIQLEG